MPTLPVDRMRCPTCGAEQDWADSCRRCRCDLRLLRAARASLSHGTGGSALNALEDGRFEIARHHARRSHELLPDAESYRLMALCDLMSERWLDALERPDAETSWRRRLRPDPAAVGPDAGSFVCTPAVFLTLRVRALA